MVGDYVCHWGATSGRSCGTIQTIHGDPGDICGKFKDGCGKFKDGDCAAVWVEVSGGDFVCPPGDSGGPVFSGSTAYGTVAYAQDAIYTPCWFMSTGGLGTMGLELLAGG
jgi:hypothetical protein